LLRPVASGAAGGQAEGRKLSSLFKDHPMSRYSFAVGLSLLAFAAGPALAQAPAAPAPAPGTVQPRHVTHPAPAHKMPKMAAVHPDQSADQLNAKELASIQHGMPASAAPMPATKKTP
jgi:hypothetical protein